MGWESFGVVRFDLGPFFRGQTRIAKSKSAYTSLFHGLRGSGVITSGDIADSPVMKKITFVYFLLLQISTILTTDNTNET